MTVSLIIWCRNACADSPFSICLSGGHRGMVAWDRRGCAHGCCDSGSVRREREGYTLGSKAMPADATDGKCL